VQRSPRLLLAIDLGVKAALLGLLLLAVVKPDLPQFEGKAMTGRAIAYPLSTVIVPVGWWLVARHRGRRTDYPYVLDILIVLPFLIDTLGNALDLYDSISWWDDLNHLVNWAILVAAFGQLLLRLPVAPWAMFGLAVGFGAVTAILWELAEYFTFIRSNPDEYRTAYTDTLGDLTLGLTGSVCAALLTVWLARRRGQRVTGTVPVTPRAAA
jgi:hypothetical protein